MPSSDLHTPSLHDALPISQPAATSSCMSVVIPHSRTRPCCLWNIQRQARTPPRATYSSPPRAPIGPAETPSHFASSRRTRFGRSEEHTSNSSHRCISYAVFRPPHSLPTRRSSDLAASSDIKLHVGGDPALPNEAVLFVEYPAASADPAARDVQLAAEGTDWSSGNAIAFRIKPAHAIRQIGRAHV